MAEILSIHVFSSFW